MERVVNGKGKGMGAILPILIISSFVLFFWQQPFFAQERVSADYKIGPGDLLEINVVGDPDFPVRRRVTEDGKISIPYLRDEISVEGMTEPECADRLEEVLAKDGGYRNPQVTVIIQEYQSKKVLVLGAVRSWGEYDLIGRTTLSEVIAKAGGFSGEEAGEIRITRVHQDGRNETLSITKEDILYKGIDPPLLPGDRIYIPEDETVQIHVLGEVNSQGTLEVKASNIPTLVQAIAQAGGFTARASQGGVIIRRKDKTIKVNVKDILSGKIQDIQLEANDTIWVKESIF
jgi:polysaccharide export outer membrane protein